MQQFCSHLVHWIPRKSYTMVFKDGADNAGTQAVWKSKSMVGASESIYQAAVVPLSLECSSSDEENSKIIWKNSAPNSATSVRPHALFRNKEDDAMKASVPHIDKMRQELMENSHALTPLRSQNQEFQVMFKIIDSMYDHKMKRAMTGNRGADCLVCETRVEDWVDEEQVLKGFDIS